MDLFHSIDDAFAIMCARGVYRQAKLFRRGSDVYAEFGRGFVRFLANGGTTAPRCNWIDVSRSENIGVNKFNAPAWLAPTKAPLRVAEARHVD